jgi:asparaginyl-tRNA synthetase
MAVCAHAGFGLGFERVIMYITGMSNIRDEISFPRTTGSAEFLAQSGCTRRKPS